MQRAVFLDRDGVINQKAPEGEYITQWDALRILPGVSDAIAMLNRLQYSVIVVTNQRCVAKGLIDRLGLDAMHQRMTTELARMGARIDAVYFCPHDLHPPCSCRKPKPGMLLDAAQTLKIDLAASWMIGDSASDVEAGKSAGCRTVRILDDGETFDGRADFSAASLLAAIRRIVEADHPGEVLGKNSTDTTTHTLS